MGKYNEVSGRVTRATTDQLKRGTIPCGEVGCTREAVSRIQVKTGWLALCRECEEARFMQTVRAYNEAQGTTTPKMSPAQRLQACRQAARALAAKMRTPDPDPKSWAREILRQHAAGREFPLIAIENARQVADEQIAPEDRSIYGGEVVA